MANAPVKWVFVAKIGVDKIKMIPFTFLFHLPGFVVLFWLLCKRLHRAIIAGAIAVTKQGTILVLFVLFVRVLFVIRQVVTGACCCGRHYTLIWLFRFHFLQGAGVGFTGKDILA